MTRSILYLDGEEGWKAFENQACDESFWKARLQTLTSWQED
jgi:hypothetical protein